MSLNIVIRYLRDHWLGRQPLWLTVWINLLSVLLLLDLAISVFVRRAEHLSDPMSPVEIAPLIVLYALSFLWQVTGTVRAMEGHIRAGGGMPSAWGTQAGLAAAFWIVLVNIWGLWLTTTIVPVSESYEERMEREHAGEYRFTVSDDGKTLRLEGEITHGVTRKIKQLISEYPRLDTLVLSSDGGNIYEGRGLARQIRETGLNTHVESTCSSACTLVFIGGVRRSMSPGAKLGFHQYRVDADYPVPFADPASEQARDRALFADAGVSEGFLREMYKKSADDMWYPTFKELRQFGILSGSGHSHDAIEPALWAENKRQYCRDGPGTLRLSDSFTCR